MCGPLPLIGDVLPMFFGMPSAAGAQRGGGGGFIKAVSIASQPTSEPAAQPVLQGPQAPAKAASSSSYGNASGAASTMLGGTEFDPKRLRLGGTSLLGG